LTMSYAGLMEALMVPSKSAELSVKTKTIMSIKVPTVEFAADDGEIDLTYGFVFTPSELDGAILSLSKLLPKMIELAQVEKTCDMLANEIEKTRRRVNAIEYIMIPDYIDTIHYVTMKLDDNERSNIIRLMKSKQIILEKDQRSKQQNNNLAAQSQ
ncbi:MAG: V-type ATP synthase subunit D, partial [Bacilli bacterium]|nr:V-type ATP synthase subunit D [Bacilli bacterium]